MKKIAFALLLVPGFASAQVSFTYGFSFGPGAFLGFNTSGDPINITAGSQPIGAGPAVHTFFTDDLSGLGGPATWGTQTLLPGTTTSDAMRLTFDLPLSFVSIEASDFGADDDVLSLWAYDGPEGTGNLVGSHVLSRSSSMQILDVQTLFVASSSYNIRSIRFSGVGINNVNNVYFDNLSMRAVPEPATSAALGLGVAALLRRRRKA
ncbi:MAG TPA: PEP-CTERM sorting domain-containing protein [Fimbriimonadaceae bacterium]|nr:PEP-CTERM sorting domain-containing protein [Fimbriimonadaceae bacterium]HRJ33827.1 PEP-CTERM sorting domain-containing protein [Fimbriimonadaceae bacterium]